MRALLLLLLAIGGAGVRAAECGAMGALPSKSFQPSSLNLHSGSCCVSVILAGYL